MTIRKTHGLFALGLTSGLILGYVGRGLVGSESPVATTTSVAEAPGITDIPAELTLVGRPSIGPEHAEVTIVEFADYQCPFCAHHFKNTYAELMAEYEGKIQYVVKNFPLATIHPNSVKAAEAAECAADQDKFWKYREVLFTRQEALEVPNLKAYAVELGLDPETFDECLDSGVKADQVYDDLRDGASHGVRSTPSFFVNGRMIAGAQPLTTFIAAVREVRENQR